MITIKTPEEIEILREGGRRLAHIVKTLALEVRPGVRTDYLNKKAEELIKEGGDTSAILNYTPRGEHRPYPASTCISVNDEVVHGIPTEHPRTLKEGDVVSLDLSITHKKLITDHAVTLSVGKVSKEIQKFIEVTEKARAIGIRAAKAGKHTGDIGFAIESFVKKHGYGIVEELAGHGVGYKVHEDPFVPNYGNKGEGALLKVGMVIAIEPIITMGNPEVFVDKNGYIFKTKDKSIAAHFEHTVVITEKGAEILTE